jgi:shikimate kinase
MSAGPRGGLRRVVLIGFMGAGKTTVGRVLAGRLGWTFLDLDESIEARAGRSVAELFAQAGEAAFRELERSAAEASLGLERYVLAAGGGAWAQPATRELLARDALTVWLRCDFETALRRIPGDGSRPLAKSRERMRKLWAEREAAYGLADVAVDTSRLQPREAADEILRALPAAVRAEGQPSR